MSQAAIDVIDATLTDAMAAFLDAQPNVEVSAASTLPVELLANGNTAAVG